jgi:hypothetical protein
MKITVLGAFAILAAIVAAVLLIRHFHKNNGQESQQNPS